MGCKKNTVIVTPLSISNVFGVQSWGCWEKKNDFFFFIKIWYSIMAIICGIVQLFDHIFFQGLQQPYPKFSSKLLLFFFFYFTEQFLGVFFRCHLIILSYAVCQTGGKLELVSKRAPKNSYRFLPYIRVFFGG